MTQAQCQRIKRQVARESGMCVRHPRSPKNPGSASFCDYCLDYWKARYTPKGNGHGRSMIPRRAA